MKKRKEALSLLIGIGLVVLWMSATGFGCPIKRITGISCAGCGMSRALLAAAHLQFSEAFYYHPLFWLCPIIIALYFYTNRNLLLFCLCLASFLYRKQHCCNRCAIRITSKSDSKAFYPYVHKAAHIIDYMPRRNIELCKSKKIVI